MIPQRHALTAYLRASYPGASRDALLARQDARLALWLARDVPRVPAFEGASGSLSDLPIMDKSVLMRGFERFNTAGITAEHGWRAFEGPKRIGRYTVGASTGTSGNRGLFVINDAERFRWLGTMLAKALPGFWRSQHRVAVMLPLNTPLYGSANQIKRLKLAFFDINEPVATWQDGLVAFDPTVIVAPPKILVMLAEAGVSVTPERVFSAAETLDPLDVPGIEAHFGVRLGQIYMATEGLFAVSCAQDTLHLCEDTMHFELPEVGDDPALREVIISDFSRQTQIMARYRMNDLIRLGTCACGSPLQAVSEVVGRADDCFRLMSPHGPLSLTPDLIRNAIVDADRRISDFRAVQVAKDRIKVALPDGMPGEVLAKVEVALNALLTRHGLKATVTTCAIPLSVPTSAKLRRVMNESGTG